MSIVTLQNCQHLQPTNTQVYHIVLVSEDLGQSSSSSNWTPVAVLWCNSRLQASCFLLPKHCVTWSVFPPFDLFWVQTLSVPKRSHKALLLKRKWGQTVRNWSLPHMWHILVVHWFSMVLLFNWTWCHSLDLSLWTLVLPLTLTENTAYWRQEFERLLMESKWEHKSFFALIFFYLKDFYMPEEIKVSTISHEKNSLSP